MIHSQEEKVVVMIEPQVTTATTAGGDEITGVVDCKGWDYLKVISINDTPSAGEYPIGDLTLGEGTASTAGSFTTIAALTINNTATAETSLLNFQQLVDLRGRKRYMGVSALASGQTGTIAAIGILSRGDIHANSAATAGAAQRKLA